MKRRAFILVVVLLALAAWAGAPRSSAVTSLDVGETPYAASAGVVLNSATAVRVRVAAAAGTITGGKICAFYLPVGAGAGGWVRSPGLDQTLPAGPLELDAGAVRALVLPDLTVAGAYGRLSFVPCGLTGTVDDAGTPDAGQDAGANVYTVTTEVWGPFF